MDAACGVRDILVFWCNWTFLFYACLSRRCAYIPGITGLGGFLGLAKELFFFNKTNLTCYTWGISNRQIISVFNICRHFLHIRGLQVCSSLFVRNKKKKATGYFACECSRIAHLTYKTSPQFGILLFMVRKHRVQGHELVSVNLWLLIANFHWQELVKCFLSSEHRFKYGLEFMS